jgi:dTDP-glucose 4,6-dehydratase
MKILVTGGAGFIGSALIRKLVNNTAHHVLNYDSLTYSGNLSSLNSIDQSDRYTFVHGDICDPEVFRSTLDNFRPQKIINLAAESHVDRSIDNPFPFFQTNVLGTLNLLHISNEYFQSLDLSGKKDFIFHHVSTDEVYGDIPLECLPCDEQYPYQPSSPYAASKASSDHLIGSWFKTFNFPTVITNCSNNYGPYHFPEKFIPHIILNALDGKNIPVYGDGSQIRDWIFVDDHVNGLLDVCFGGTPGQTYNIGGSNEVKNIDTAEIICNILDKKIALKPNNIQNFHQLIKFVPDRPGHDLRYAINSSKIQKCFSWSPQETFDSGLEKTVEWYIEHKDWWQEILEKKYTLARLGNLK